MPKGIPVVIGIGERGIEIIRLVKGLAYPFKEAPPLGWLGVWASTAREASFTPPFPLDAQEVVRVRPHYTEILPEEYALPWWQGVDGWLSDAARLRGRLAWFWDQEIDGVRLVTQRLSQVFHAVTERDLSKRIRLFMVVDISDPLFPFALDLAAWLRGAGHAEGLLPQNLEIVLVLIGQQEASLQERKWGAASLRELARILAHPYQGWITSAQGRRVWLTKRLFDYVFLSETQPHHSKGFADQDLSGSVAAFLRWLAVPAVGAKVFEYLTNQSVGEGYSKALRFAIWFTGSAWKLYRPWCVYRTLQEMVCHPLKDKPVFTLEDFFSGVTDEVYTLFLHLRREGQGRALTPHWDENFISHALHYAEEHLQTLQLGAQICWLIHYARFLEAVLRAADKLGHGMARSRHPKARTQGKILMEGVRRGHDWLSRVKDDILLWEQMFGVPCDGSEEHQEAELTDRQVAKQICAYLNRQSAEWEAWVDAQRNNNIYEFWEGEGDITYAEIGAAHQFGQMMARKLRMQWRREGVVLNIGEKELYAPPQRQIVVKALENLAGELAGEVIDVTPWAAEAASEVDCLKFDDVPEQWFSAQCPGGCGGNTRLRVWGAPKYAMAPPAGMCLRVPLDEQEALFGLLQVEGVLLQRWEIWNLYLEKKRTYEPDSILHPFLPEYFATQIEALLQGHVSCWKSGIKAFAPSFVRFWVCPLAVRLLSYAWLYGWVHQTSEVPPRWELRLPEENTPLMTLSVPSNRASMDSGGYWLFWLEQVVERCVRSRLPLTDDVLENKLRRARAEQISAERWEARQQMLKRWQDQSNEALCSWAWYLESLIAEEIEKSSH